MVIKCSKCRNRAVFSNPYLHTNLCKQHFFREFEKKVSQVIRNNSLFSRNSRVCVAVSGGKDSSIALLLSKKVCRNVSAIAVDEGIGVYRPVALAYLRKFCKLHKIPLKVYSFKAEFGHSLDELINLLPDIKPCSICGILRRHLINKASCGFDVVVTGHNLDDEAQSILMNLFYSNAGLLARLGSMTGIRSNSFVQRVKPLYLCSERETAAYAFLKDYGVPFVECPYSEHGLRASVRNELNILEADFPGSKQRFVANFLAILPELKARFKTLSEPKSCASCNSPCEQDLCNACKILVKVKINS